MQQLNLKRRLAVSTRHHRKTASPSRHNADSLVCTFECRPKMATQEHEMVFPNTRAGPMPPRTENLSPGELQTLHLIRSMHGHSISESSDRTPVTRRFDLSRLLGKRFKSLNSNPTCYLLILLNSKLLSRVRASAPRDWNVE